MGLTKGAFSNLINAQGKSDGFTTGFENELDVPLVPQDPGARVTPALELANELAGQMPNANPNARMMPGMLSSEEEQGRGVPQISAIPLYEDDELTQQQVQRKQAAEQRPLTEFKPEEGAFAMTENVNKRLGELSQSIEERDLTTKDSLLAQQGVEVKNQSPFAEISRGEVSDIFNRSQSLANEMVNPESIALTEPKSGQSATLGQLTNVVLGSQADTQTQAMALDISMLTELLDINSMNLRNQNKTSAVQEGSMEDALDALRYSQTYDPAENLGVKEDKGVGEVKAMLNPDAKEGIDINQYKFIHNAARKLVSRAQKMLGLTPKDLEENASNEAELGEYILQRGIDNGDIGIYSFTDSASGKKYYYPQLIQQGLAASKAARSISIAANPSNEVIDLGSTTPTNNLGIVGEYQFDRKKGTVIKRNGQELSPSEVTLALNGGVGRVVEPELLSIVQKLFDMGDAAYFKNDEVDYKKTYNENYNSNLAIYRKLGYGEEQAKAKADAAARRIADTAKETKLQKTRNDLQLLINRLEDTDSEGNQLIKYAEWSISEVNNRIQEISRDMQSDSKDVIRAADGFAEKAYIQRSAKLIDPARSKMLADKFRNIVYLSPVQMRNGEKALEMFNSLPEAMQVEINTKTMWAGIYLKLAGKSAPPYKYDKFYTGNANTKRMSPPQMLDYFSQNEKLIMDTLAGYGSVVNGWVQGTNTIPKPEDRKGWEKDVLERGELPYFISNLIDINKYAQAPEGANIKLMGMYEIDANNSNIALQTIRTGNISSATLGFMIDPKDPAEWYNTDKNPDSFYTILSDNLADVIDVTFNDEDKASALKGFIANILDSGGGKNLTRDSVVAGFYGLHPGVNVASIRDILTAYSKEAETYLVKSGVYKSVFDSDLMNDLLDTQGANFNKVLGKLSINRVVKQIGSIIALNGDFDPEIVTDMGEIIKSQVGELMPDYLEDVAMEEATGGRLTARPEPSYYIDPKGNKNMTLRVASRIDDRKERTTVDVDGNVKEIHKEHGSRFMDGLSAIITHTMDAALEKLAIMAQNKGRAISSPISIHDANKLNAKSYTQHWISYNMIAIPSLAAQTDIFTHLYDKAIQSLEQLNQIESQAEKDKVNINIGTESSKHRSLMNILDHTAEYEAFKVIPSEEEYRAKGRNSKARLHDINERKRYRDLLKIASDNGWISQDERTKVYQDIRANGGDPLEMRKYLAVTPAQFRTLIEIIKEIQGFKPREGYQRSPVNMAINEWTNKAQANLKHLKSGRFLSNAQN